ncbi:MAG: LapA family protein [Thermodesulfobacteriota bacterium]
MRYLKFLALLAFFVLTMTLFAQNMEALKAVVPLSLNLASATWFSIEYPVYFLILGAFFLGGLVTVLFFFLERMRLAKELGQCRGRMATLEQEVNSLRTLPLEDKGYPAAGESSPGGGQ